MAFCMHLCRVSRQTLCFFPSRSFHVARVLYCSVALFLTVLLFVRTRTVYSFAFHESYMSCLHYFGYFDVRVNSKQMELTYAACFDSICLRSVLLSSFRLFATFCLFLPPHPFPPFPTIREYSVHKTVALWLLSVVVVAIYAVTKYTSNWQLKLFLTKQCNSNGFYCYDYRLQTLHHTPPFFRLVYRRSNVILNLSISVVFNVTLATEIQLEWFRMVCVWFGSSFVQIHESSDSL